VSRLAVGSRQSTYLAVLPMLEPTAIHRYEPPAYKVEPPSAKEGPPAVLPFQCVVLEAADAPGSPPPALLHLLRERGCLLILAQHIETDIVSSNSTRCAVNGQKPAFLSEEWFPAVFDKVIDMTEQTSKRLSPLVMYLADNGIPPTSAVCFASTEAGVRAFHEADVGLIVTNQHRLCWELCPSSDEDDQVLHLHGADVAATVCPTARQLSWLFRVRTEQHWCVCLWLSPPNDEFLPRQIHPDLPSREDRAKLTSVASYLIDAQGHPPWAPVSRDWQGPPACTARWSGDGMVACPDWTPMEPLLRWTAEHNRLSACEVPVRTFPKVTQYCHSLDVGIAQVNHAFEAEDYLCHCGQSITTGSSASGYGRPDNRCRNPRCRQSPPDKPTRVRVSSRRFVSQARSGSAGADLSVTIWDPLHPRRLPDIVVRSSLRCEPSAGVRMLTSESGIVPVVIDSGGGCPMLTAAYSDEHGKTVVVRAWHRLLRDDGRGEVQLNPSAHEGSVRAESFRDGGCGICLIFANPRRGTRYTVEKVVAVHTDSFLTTPSAPMPRLSSPGGSMLYSEPATDAANYARPLVEVDEEHRSSWGTEWDRADIEIEGTRSARQCQRAVRLFRYHQVARGDPTGSARASKRLPVPELARWLFSASVEDFLPDDVMDQSTERQKLRPPSSLITSRITVFDPRDPPVLKINPKVPPACVRLLFNVSLGGRWHRFTLTPGKVRILVQGPTMVRTITQLFGEVVKTPPKFVIEQALIPDVIGEKVEVKASAWHEVHVQHSVTHLGRPDGSAGGFYSLMRRTRFVRTEVLRRLLADAEGDYWDDTLRHPLKNCLGGLQSVPRPSHWRPGHDEHLHLLKADDGSPMTVNLAYEKTELEKDIAFLEGRMEKVDGPLEGETMREISGESMTLDQAKQRCLSLPGCIGFSFEGDVGPATIKVLFKGEGRLDPEDASKCPSSWTSFRRIDGETTLLEQLEGEYERTFRPKDAEGNIISTPWAYDEMPPWNGMIEEVLRALEAAAAAGGRREEGGGAPAAGFEGVTGGGGGGDRRPFRNFITDRDGTTNNYCDRYASSVQSAYNAAWLSHFARNCTDSAVFITAAPLGGRPTAEGLMELSVAPRRILRDGGMSSLFIYAGSKGREYFDADAQRVMETESLPSKQRELMDELHRRILTLCAQPGNAKFLGIGSGLQRKFGEVTMARNDPGMTVPEPESRRFMAAVRKVKDELDPDGLELDLHDTGLDMELFPRTVGGRASFDKGHGVKSLDEKLQLKVGKGPNVVCGDTASDLAMIKATLRLMLAGAASGERMVDSWMDKISEEDVQMRSDQNDSASEPPAGEPSHFDSDSEGEELSEEEKREKEAEEERRRLEEEREEEEAREIGKRLAIIFVITPEQAEKDLERHGMPLAGKIKRLAELSGANLAIVPCPDVLVAGLARYADKEAGRRVTEVHPQLDGGQMSRCSSSGEFVVDHISSARV